VKSLGNKGDIKDVSEGYARNFLIPKKLAEAATAQAIEKVDQMKKKVEEKEKQTEENLRNIASEIQNKKITIGAKTEKEKLFGSIGAKEISEEMKKQGFEISEKSIILKEPIKTVGEEEITIDFGKNIKTKIVVAIEKA
jgi:large subunit ribosomal protein L9